MVCSISLTPLAAQAGVALEFDMERALENLVQHRRSSRNQLQRDPAQAASVILMGIATLTSSIPAEG